MKKHIVALFMLMFAGSSYAQWTSDLDVNTKVSVSSPLRTSSMRTITNQKGNTYLTWYEQGDPASSRNGVTMRAQLIDKNGFRKWGSRGVLINNSLLNNFMVYNLAIDKDDNLIVATQDDRAGTLLDIQMPSIYKYDESGNLLWKKELNDSIGHVDLAAGPIVAITSDNDILISWTCSYVDRTTRVENGWASVQKLSGSTGDYKWAHTKIIVDPLKKAGYKYPHVLMSENDDFFVYFQSQDYPGGQTIPHYPLAMKMDKNGNNLWSSFMPVTSRSISLGTFYNSMELFSDKAGGMIVVFTSPSTSSVDVFAQHIDATGSRSWGNEGVLTAKNIGGSYCTFGGAVQDSANNKILVSLVRHTTVAGASEKGSGLRLQGIDYSGNLLYGDLGYEALPQSLGTAATSVDGKSLVQTNDDGVIFVYETKSDPLVKGIKAIKINKHTGEKMWGDGNGTVDVTTIPTGVRLLSDGTMRFINNQVVVGFLGFYNGRGQDDPAIVKVQNILNDGNGGPGNAVNQAVTFMNHQYTYGDLPFDPGAFSTSGLKPVYTVDNPEVAVVDSANNRIIIVGAGTANIQAYFPESIEYRIAKVTKSLVVNKKLLNAIADDKKNIKGNLMPTLTITYDGFANNEDVTFLTKMPATSSPATKFSPAGIYPIDIAGGISANYEFVYKLGQLTVLAEETGEQDNLEVWCSNMTTVHARVFITESQRANLQLIDLNGRVLYNNTINMYKGYNDYDIPVANLTSGVYIVKLANNQLKLTQKVKVK